MEVSIGIIFKGLGLRKVVSLQRWSPYRGGLNWRFYCTYMFKIVVKEKV